MEKLRALIIRKNFSLKFYTEGKLHFVEMLKNGKIFYQFKSFNFKKARSTFFALVGINWLYENESGGQHEQGDKIQK